MIVYFFDTYALLEILNGNKNYLNFKNVSFRTTLFNLYELYFNVLKSHGEEDAIKSFNRFAPFLIDIKNEHIFFASKFRLKNYENKFSYIDALGYSISKIEGYKFITGDRAFEFFENVEFVK